MGDLHQPPTDPNQAILERLNRLETTVQQWQNGQIVCHPSEGRLRIIRGQIDSTAPTINYGSGFTIVKNSTGDVTITFTTPFSAAPAFVVGPYTEGVSWRFAEMNLSLPTTSTARVGLKAEAGGAVDGHFDFIAVGPV